MTIVNRPAFTENQRKIRVAISSCKHSLRVIADKSGVSISTLQNWTYGNCQPRVALMEFVLQAIKELNMEPPPFRWKDHVPRIMEEMKTRTTTSIAKDYGVNPSNIRCAVIYYRLTRNKKTTD